MLIGRAVQNRHLAQLGVELLRLNLKLGASRLADRDLAAELELLRVVVLSVPHDHVPLTGQLVDLGEESDLLLRDVIQLLALVHCIGRHPLLREGGLSARVVEISQVSLLRADLLLEHDDL